MQKTTSLRSRLSLIPVVLVLGCTEAPRQTPEQLQSCRNTLAPTIEYDENPDPPNNRTELLNNIINFVRSGSINEISENSTHYLYKFFGGEDHELFIYPNGAYSIGLQTPGEGSADELTMNPTRRFYGLQFNESAKNRILLKIDVRNRGGYATPNTDYMENFLRSGWQSAFPIYSMSFSQPRATTPNAWTRWIARCYLGRQEFALDITLDQNGSFDRIYVSGNRNAP